MKNMKKIKKICIKNLIYIKDIGMKIFLIEVLIKIIYIIIFMLLLNVISCLIGILTDNKCIISFISFTLSVFIIYIMIKNENNIFNNKRPKR